jgi:fermentation-respiration switch protein FrsA (DUF1100 family)
MLAARERAVAANEALQDAVDRARADGHRRPPRIRPAPGQPRRRRRPAAPRRRYFLSGFSYNEVATARTLPQPLLFLQGDRDYQVTVANDLDVWLRGLRGRAGVTVVQFPDADHLFLNGIGPATPLDYQKAGHVDPAVIATIVGWINRVDTSNGG